MASWSSTHVQCDGCRQSSLIWSLRGVCCVRRSRGIPVSVGIVGGRRHPDGDDAVGDSGVRHHTCAAVANDWTPAKHRPPDLWRSEIVAGSPERPETHICHKAVPLGTAPVLTAVKTRGGGSQPSLAYPRPGVRANGVAYAWGGGYSNHRSLVIAQLLPPSEGACCRSQRRKGPLFIAGWMFTDLVGGCRIATGCCRWSGAAE
jgi:hypothetical protein